MRPVWVANNHTGTSTLYDGTGAAQPAGTPLVVHLPSSSGGAAFAPTGIVGNTTTDFVVSEAAKSAAAPFIFSGEGGMIAGWSKNVDVSNAVVMYTDAGGAVYKGLAIANNGSGNFLYATDFHNNKVDVFDAHLHEAGHATSFTFKDPSLPAGYAPFGIQALTRAPSGAVQIYVTYAMQQAPANHDNENGAGLGIVDIYDANGVFVKTLVGPGQALNAPWGIALAPADFGTLSGVLLVGNFGDGKINGYDPASGQFMGTLTMSGGASRFRDCGGSPSATTPTVSRTTVCSLRPAPTVRRTGATGESTSHNETHAHRTVARLHTQSRAQPGMPKEIAASLEVRDHLAVGVNQSRGSLIEDEVVTVKEYLLALLDEI